MLISSGFCWLLPKAHCCGVCPLIALPLLLGMKFPLEACVEPADPMFGWGRSSDPGMFLRAGVKVGVWASGHCQERGIVLTDLEEPGSSAFSDGEVELTGQCLPGSSLASDRAGSWLL